MPNETEKKQNVDEPAELKQPAGVSAPDEDDEPVLTIETVTKKRPRIVVDDKIHELRMQSDMGIVEQQEQQADGVEYAKLYSKEGGLNKKEKARLEFLFDRMFKRSVCDYAALKDIPDDAKQEIVTTFTEAPARKRLARMRQMAQEAGIDLSDLS